MLLAMGKVGYILDVYQTRPTPRAPAERADRDMSNIATRTDAVKIARALGLTLSKYADPIEGHRTDIDPDDSYVTEVLAADPTLIYVDLDGVRVAGGKPGTPDHDTGLVLAVSGDELTVGWDSGQRTTQIVGMLYAIS